MKETLIPVPLPRRIQRGIVGLSQQDAYGGDLSKAAQTANCPPRIPLWGHEMTRRLRLTGVWSVLAEKQHSEAREGMSTQRLGSR